MSERISASALQAILGQPQLCVLDASWYLPGDNRDVRREFSQEHIPGAQFFDFDTEVCLPDSKLPHMLPTPAQFTTHARRLGVDRSTTIVVYDTQGCFSAPRAWWMFRAMGHARCLVLDGGLPAWREARFAFEPGYPQEAKNGNFEAVLQPDCVASCEQVQAALDDDATVVIDARPPGRFTGSVAEPRAGLRSGHAPGSINLPSSVVCKDGRLRDADALREVFASAAPSEQRIITSCGSGVTACILALAALEAGRSDVAVYDGSWAEWGARGELPVVTGGS